MDKKKDRTMDEKADKPLEESELDTDKHTDVIEVPLLSADKTKRVVVRVVTKDGEEIVAFDVLRVVVSLLMYVDVGETQGRLSHIRKLLLANGINHLTSYSALQKLTSDKRAKLALAEELVYLDEDLKTLSKVSTSEPSEAKSDATADKPEGCDDSGEGGKEASEE